MKVYIGPYVNWVGPYQIANFLERFGVSEDRCSEIGDWLSKTWVNTACQWIHKKQKRKVKVKVDYYDAWSADHTLALVIHPVLKRLNEVKHGAPYTDDDDAPDCLSSQLSAPYDKENGETDEFHFKRWDYILNEMLWAFGEEASGDKNEPDQYIHDDNQPTDGHSEGAIALGLHHLVPIEGADVLNDAYHLRKANGFRLFGKYYRHLWD